MTRREDTDSKLESMTLSSAVWPNLPGVLLQAALASALVWGVGHLLVASAKSKSPTLLYGAIALGAVIVILVAVATNSWLAVSASILCCCFAVLSPKSPRNVMPDDLGPLFKLAIGLIALMFVMLTAVMFLGWTAALQSTVAAFDTSVSHLAEPRIMAGLALIMLACIFLFSPLWALAQHIRTLFVLAAGFRLAGVAGVVISLLLCVASTPICRPMKS